MNFFTIFPFFVGVLFNECVPMNRSGGDTMYHTVVMTCGVSIFGSDNIFSQKSNDKPDINVSLQEKAEKEQIDSIKEKYLQFARTVDSEILEKPTEVSAEYSMLYALREKGKLGKHPKVILLLTNTVGGEISKELLCYLFEKYFQSHVEALFVDIDVSNPAKLNTTIGDYLLKLSIALEQGEPNSTCFAPIGGYKVMTSFGSIVGSFLNYPTAYLHETNQVLHEIPPIPLDIKDEFVHQNVELLRKCQRNYQPLSELTKAERIFIKQFPSLFHLEDEFVGLTAFGLYLFERSKYEHLFGTKYVASKQVRNFTKQNRRQSIFIYQQMRELVKKLKHGEARQEEIRHELQFQLNPKKINFHLYKGADNGITPFRLAYRYEEEEDVLYANYLWLDHNLYEREAESTSKSPVLKI